MAYRLFIGLSPPEDVAEALSRLQDGLPGARWRDPESFHLTLAFVGDASARTFEDLAAALTSLSAPGFTLDWTEPGVFGAEGRPRAVWAGVRAEPGLLLLQGRVEAAMRSVGLTPEARRFVPHVTLAYLARASDADVAKYVGERSLLHVPPWPVGEFHLYSSHLGGGHSIYRIEETCYLERKV
ncbi:MAG: RNA 2',3'-cyclic phosphodiesterase [Pseudomonadota bacterium]